MVDFIYTAREHHGVKHADDLRRRHVEFIARKARRGARFTVHDDPTPLIARVDSNSWLADCPSCNAGIAIEPEMGVGCCFGCGAVYATLLIPSAEKRAAIEDVLLARPKAPWRTWLPGETVDQLKAQNITYGVPPSRSEP